MDGTRLAKIPDPRSWEIHEFIDLEQEEFLQDIRSKFKDARTKTGGVLRIFFSDAPSQGPMSWHEAHTSHVGEQEDNRTWAKYELISFEKALRLMKHSARNGHVSSWQSRNLNCWEFGGAILVKIMTSSPSGLESLWIILSFSGLPEACDEAYCLALAKNLGWLDHNQYQAILSVSKNEVALNFVGFFDVGTI